MEINIGGRALPLKYTAYEMIAIQREIGCTAFELKDKVFGIHLADEDDPNSVMLEVLKDPERLEKMGALIAILANAGLEEEGETADITGKWVLRNMKPVMVLTYAIAAMTEISNGNMMEEKHEENAGPVDEGLEEIQAKKQPGN